MNRKYLNRLEQDSQAGIDISSLIDICFLLLIYFITTTVILPAEKDLRMGHGLPGEDKIGLAIDPLQININPNGLISEGQGFSEMQLDADPGVRDLHLLESRLDTHLQVASAAGQELMVVINADDGAQTQRVVDVLNSLAGKKIKRVTFMDPDDRE